MNILFCFLVEQHNGRAKEIHDIVDGSTTDGGNIGSILYNNEEANAATGNIF
jgi:hypothetical protein